MPNDGKEDSNEKDENAWWASKSHVITPAYLAAVPGQKLWACSVAWPALHCPDPVTTQLAYAPMSFEQMKMPVSH